MTWKQKAAAFFGFLASLLLVFFLGRRNRRGEVNVAVAQRELELANNQHDKLVLKMEKLNDRRADIAADIIEEETLRSLAVDGSRKLSDEEINRRLTDDHLLR